MGKNRRSLNSGGASNQPKETPEEFQKRYDEARERLENWKELNNNGNITNPLSKPQIKRLLDAVLDENTHFVGVGKSLDGKHQLIYFEERTTDADGNVKTTGITFDSKTYKNTYKKNANISIEDLMDAYRSIPLYRRNLARDVNFGATGQNFLGGFYSPLQQSVNINSSLFSKKGINDIQIEQALFHEFTHSTDNNSAGYFDYGSVQSPVFMKIMKTNKASAYSEGYHKNTDSYYNESLAEAVAVTMAARKYGGDVAQIEDPDKARGNYISYDKWSKQNKDLADFANKFIDCKNTDEVRALFNG